MPGLTFTPINSISHFPQKYDATSSGPADTQTQETIAQPISKADNADNQLSPAQIEELREHLARMPELISRVSQLAEQVSQLAQRVSQLADKVGQLAETASPLHEEVPASNNNQPQRTLSDSCREMNDAQRKETCPKTQEQLNGLTNTVAYLQKEEEVPQETRASVERHDREPNALTKTIVHLQNEEATHLIQNHRTREQAKKDADELSKLPEMHRRIRARTERNADEIIKWGIETKQLKQSYEQFKKHLDTVSVVMTHDKLTWSEEIERLDTMWTALNTQHRQFIQEQALILQALQKAGLIDQKDRGIISREGGSNRKRSSQEIEKSWGKRSRKSSKVGDWVGGNPAIDSSDPKEGQLEILGARPGQERQVYNTSQQTLREKDLNSSAWRRAAMDDTHIDQALTQPHVAQMHVPQVVISPGNPLSNSDMLTPIEKHMEHIDFLNSRNFWEKEGIATNGSNINRKQTSKEKDQKWNSVTSTISNTSNLRDTDLAQVRERAVAGWGSKDFAEAEDEGELEDITLVARADGEPEVQGPGAFNRLLSRLPFGSRRASLDIGKEASVDMTKAVDELVIKDE